MIEHCDRVNSKYNTESTPHDFSDCELDFPITINPETEVFNYNLNNKDK